MSFSLRLTAKLTLAWAARAIGAKRNQAFLQQLPADHAFDSASVRSGAGVSQRFLPRIVWIGGPDPLDYPDSAALATFVSSSGRHVFLETSGTSLRLRLHDFQPSSNFYFVIRFDGRGESAIGLEALRMASLAGFFTCAHVVLQPGMPSSEVEGMHREIHKLDVDGVLITAGEATPQLREQAELLRKRLLGFPCRCLSYLLDAGVPASTVRASENANRSPLPERQSESLRERAEVR